jgi:hypothetical protein
MKFGYSGMLLVWWNTPLQKSYWITKHRRRERQQQLLRLLLPQQVGIGMATVHILVLASGVAA